LQNVELPVRRLIGAARFILIGGRLHLPLARPPPGLAASRQPCPGTRRTPTARPCAQAARHATAPKIKKNRTASRPRSHPPGPPQRPACLRHGPASHQRPPRRDERRPCAYGGPAAAPAWASPGLAPIRHQVDVGHHTGSRSRDQPRSSSSGQWQSVSTAGQVLWRRPCRRAIPLRRARLDAGLAAV